MPQRVQVVWLAFTSCLKCSQAPGRFLTLCCLRTVSCCLLQLHFRCLVLVWCCSWPLPCLWWGICRGTTLWVALACSPQGWLGCQHGVVVQRHSCASSGHCSGSAWDHDGQGHGLSFGSLVCGMSLVPRGVSLMLSLVAGCWRDWRVTWRPLQQVKRSPNLVSIKVKVKVHELNSLHSKV